MSDTFNNGIQIPNVGPGVTARDAETGYIRIYARENKIFARLPNGTEYEVTPENGGSFQNVFFQEGVSPVEPVNAPLNQPYLVYVINGDEVTPYLWEPDV